MTNSILNTILLAGCFLLLFGFGELLHHYFKVKAEITRKIIHIGTGLLTLFFPILLDNHWLVLFLCSSFALILIGSLKFKLLKSINAIERKSIGSIAYPISVYFCYLFYEITGHRIYYFYLPILILAICDPLAAFFGKKWPIGKYNIGETHKTIVGTVSFVISSFMLSFILLTDITVFGTYKIFYLSICLSLVTGVAEAISKKGYDNLTIPLSALITLVLLTSSFY